MPNPRWMLDERLCLDILNTDFDNTKVEARSIFGRIFGQRWQTTGRQPYTPQRNVDRFVSKESKLYCYGGIVKRLTSSDSKIFDAMICPKFFCSFCQNYEQYANLPRDQARELASRAENASWIPANSPLCGFPFVHVWRDCDREPEPNHGNRYTFSPLPPKPTDEPEIPTWTSQIAFDDSQNGADDGSGCFGYRETGLCDPALCDVCRISDERAEELLAGAGQA